LYDKRLPWHAIWHANEGRIRDGVRGDAWGCGLGEIIRRRKSQKTVQDKETFTMKYCAIY